MRALSIMNPEDTQSRFHRLKRREYCSKVNYSVSFATQRLQFSSRDLIIYGILTEMTRLNSLVFVFILALMDTINDY